MWRLLAEGRVAILQHFTVHGAGIQSLSSKDCPPAGRWPQLDRWTTILDLTRGSTDLSWKKERGAERFGAVTVFADVVSTDLEAQPKRIETKSGVFTARAVVLATGAVAHKLEVEGEDKLVGRGVAYCATCDGMLYRDKTVVVVGGGNSAVTDVYLSKIRKKAYLLHRRDTLRASKVYLDSLKNSGVEFLWNSRVKELLYDKRLTGMKLEEISMLLCEAVYQP